MTPREGKSMAATAPTDKEYIRGLEKSVRGLNETIDGLLARANRAASERDALFASCKGINPEAVPELLAACQAAFAYMSVEEADAAAYVPDDYSTPVETEAALKLLNEAITKAVS